MGLFVLAYFEEIMIGGNGKVGDNRKIQAVKIPLVFQDICTCFLLFFQHKLDDKLHHQNWISLNLISREVLSAGMLGLKLVAQ
jgi:hypothetical protein